MSRQFTDFPPTCFDMHLQFGDMATTIFATVTITATAIPPPTTVLVATPCTNPAQIITATFTAPKLPDEYPLHLFPLHPTCPPNRHHHHHHYCHHHAHPNQDPTFPQGKTRHPPPQTQEEFRKVSLAAHPTVVSCHSHHASRNEPRSLGSSHWVC